MSSDTIIRYVACLHHFLWIARVWVCSSNPGKVPVNNEDFLYKKMSTGNKYYCKKRSHEWKTGSSYEENLLGLNPQHRCSHLIRSHSHSLYNKNQDAEVIRIKNAGDLKCLPASSHSMKTTVRCYSFSSKWATWSQEPLVPTDLTKSFWNVFWNHKRLNLWLLEKLKQGGNVPFPVFDLDYICVSKEILQRYA